MSPVSIGLSLKLNKPKHKKSNNRPVYSSVSRKQAFYKDEAEVELEVTEISNTMKGTQLKPRTVQLYENFIRNGTVPRDRGQINAHSSSVALHLPFRDLLAMR